MKKVGAFYNQNRTCEFNLWAPFCDSVALKLISQQDRLVQMEKSENGYFSVIADGILPDTKYLYRLNGAAERPDPASFFQPEGVHKPSQIIDHGRFSWSDTNWRNIPIEKMIIYELHVGTFTPEGTFRAIIPRLEALSDLGINAIEIMPISQFPGSRNWGYDGVHPFSVQNSYGSPDELKELVDCCHSKGIAVILDAVYNHLGPEGNYFGMFGPYFTDRYKTPWGSAINFDGPQSDDVRNFFIFNALYWLKTFHIDALRIDAVHSIYDFGAKHFLKELAEEVDALSKLEKRPFFLIAESDLSDVKIIESRDIGGFGMDSQWCDDFHHLIHVLLTGERNGYYEDFTEIDQLVKQLREGFVYSWGYSKHRKKRHGSSSQGKPGDRFVVSIQNHDQVGNRMFGERLSKLVSFEPLKLAAGLMLVSPYVPMLFMGEEYGEEAPFLYFVSHGDENLRTAVREGRKKEFETFRWKGEPPDPQDDQTFLKSKLNWERRIDEKHAILLAFYKELITLRKKTPALSSLKNQEKTVGRIGESKLIFLHRGRLQNSILGLFNFENIHFIGAINLPPGNWSKIFDSSEKRWQGPGSQVPQGLQANQTINLNPHQMVLFENLVLK